MARTKSFQVFATAFTLFFVETAMFHLLQFTHTYLESTLVISYALMGLALGSIAASFIPSNRVPSFRYFALALAFSVILAFINIVRFPRLVRLSPLLMMPFMVGNVLLTVFFRVEDPARVYFSDLLGATAGVLFSVIAIPGLKSENALALCVSLLCAGGLVLGRGRRTGGTARVLLAAILALSLLFIAANLRWHVWELEAVAIGQGAGRAKDFSAFRASGMPFLLSRDSLVARISVYADRSGEHYYRTADGSTSNETDRVCFDGDNNDVLDSAGLHAFRNDPRIPFMSWRDGRRPAILRARPKVLIIGTSAQGIVKSVRYLVKDPALIQGVEINPAIIHLMNHELSRLSGRAYEGVSVQNIDARAFLRHDPSRYDLITMLNTYTVQVIGYFGEPDFVHTCDAFNTYFDHLSDGGFLLLEERGTTERARYAIYRQMINVIRVLQARGCTDPRQHLFIYAVNDKEMDPDEWYTFVVAKKTPLSKEERRYFSEWIETRQAIERGPFRGLPPDGDVTSIFCTRLLFLAGRDLPTDVSRFLRAPALEMFWGSGLRMSPTTDDRPYIFDVYADRRDTRRLLVEVGAACAGVLAVAAVLLLARRRRGSAGPSLVLFPFFILLGLGYFILEITLMKLYQSFTGSPTNSLVFVLAGMLLSSAAGAQASRGWPPRRRLRAWAGIVPLALLHLMVGRQALSLVGGSLWLSNAALMLGILPLGFLMGIPFPSGLEETRRIASEEPIPLFVAANSLASAFGIALGLSLCAGVGFTATGMVATSCYAAAFLLWITRRFTLPRPASEGASGGPP